nr:hypothetical protein [uncultured Capnocytophaga sp.]
MKVSKIIIEKILNDNNFSIELAKRLGNQQQSVLGLARRNSRNLTLWEAVLFYKEQGFSEEQIFYDLNSEKATPVDKKLSN